MDRLRSGTNIDPSLVVVGVFGVVEDSVDGRPCNEGVCVIDARAVLEGSYETSGVSLREADGSCHCGG